MQFQNSYCSDFLTQTIQQFIYKYYTKVKYYKWNLTWIYRNYHEIQKAPKNKLHNYQLKLKKWCKKWLRNLLWVLLSLFVRWGIEPTRARQPACLSLLLLARLGWGREEKNSYLFCACKVECRRHQSLTREVREWYRSY